MVKVRDIIFDKSRLALIAGPCVVEGKEMLLETAAALKEICTELGLPLIFKSSYKKANRTSHTSFMGIGDTEALELLKLAGSTCDVPLVTDVHSIEEARLAAEYVDLLQIPAFLSRQTELLTAAGETGKAVNIKKGQFLAPEDMKHAVDKVKAAGNSNVLVTERGTFFGYHNLVVDMRGLVEMRQTGAPVIMDATHAVQVPSKGGVSGGRPEFIPALARAAVAVGIDGLFMEVHPDPPNAKSDAGSQFRLGELKPFLQQIAALDKMVRGFGDI